MWEFLFRGGLWIVPLGLSFLVVLLWCFVTFRRNLERRRGLRLLYFGRTLIPLLPLSGIMGTVWGLIDTISYMAAADLTAPGTLSETMGRFATALNTTFWGIVGAGVCIFLYEMSIAAREAVEDES